MLWGGNRGQGPRRMGDLRLRWFCHRTDALGRKPRARTSAYGGSPPSLVLPSDRCSGEETAGKDLGVWGISAFVGSAIGPMLWGGTRGQGPRRMGDLRLRWFCHRTDALGRNPRARTSAYGGSPPSLVLPSDRCSG